VTRREFATALRAIGDCVRKEVALAKIDLQREFRSTLRRARLRRWSRKDIDRYVMSKKGLPDEAFKK
jgi:hypothetical protein